MKFLKVFFATILSIVLTIILTGAVFIFTINLFITKDNIEKIVSEVDIANMLLEYDNDIDPKIQEHILSVPEVRSLINRISGEATEYIFYKKNIPQIENKDIDNIVNSSYFESALEIKLTEEEKISLKNILQDASLSLNKELEINLNNLAKKVENEPILKTIISPNINIIIIVLLLVVTILIGVCRWSWYRLFSWVGISMIISGIFNLGLNTIAKPMLNSSQTNNDLTIKMMDSLYDKWMMGAVVVMILGVAFLIAYFVIGNIKNKKIKTL